MEKYGKFVFSLLLDRDVYENRYVGIFLVIEMRDLGVVDVVGRDRMFFVVFDNVKNVKVSILD